MKNVVANKIESISAKLGLNLKTIFKNSFWVSTESLFSLVLGLLVVYAMANFLDPNIAGQYKYLISLAAIVASFTIAGVTYAVSREAALGNDSFFHYATNKSLRWSLLPISIAILIASYYSYMGNSVYAFSFLLATVFSVMLANFSIYRSYLSGKENFKLISVYANSVLVVSTFFTVITFYTTDNLIYLILGTLGINFLALLIIYYVVRKSIPNTGIDPQSISKFDEYVYSQSMINVISVGATHLDKVILFQLLGPVELAVYTFVTVLPEKVRGLLKTFSNIIFPKFVRRDLSTIQDKIFKESSLFLLFLFSVFVITLMITPFVFSLFLPKYVEYTYLSLVYSLSIFSVLAIVPYAAIQAKNLKKKLYAYEIVNSIVQIAFVVVGILQGGLLGAIVGRLLASLSGIFILYTLLKWK